MLQLNNLFGKKEEENHDLFSELLIRVVFVKQIYETELKKPVLPPVLIMNVLTSYTMKDLKEKIKNQHEVNYESRFLYQFKVLHDSDYIPVECFESMKTLEEDDFYRPRLIYCIDLNFPFSSETESSKNLEYESSKSEVSSRPNTSGSTRDYKLFNEVQGFEFLAGNFHEESDNLGNFNLFDQLKNIGCEQYFSTLVAAGFYQEGSFANIKEEDFSKNKIFAPKSSRVKMLELAGKIKRKLTIEYEKEARRIPARDFEVLTKYENREVDHEKITREKSVKRRIYKIRRENELRNSHEPSLSLPYSFHHPHHHQAYHSLSTAKYCCPSHLQRAEYQKQQIKEKIILQIIAALHIALQFITSYVNLPGGILSCSGYTQMNQQERNDENNHLFASIDEMISKAIEIFQRFPAWKDIDKENEFSNYMKKNACLTLDEIHEYERNNQISTLYSSHSNKESVELSLFPIKIYTKEKFLATCLEYLELQNNEL